MRKQLFWALTLGGLLACFAAFSQTAIPPTAILPAKSIQKSSVLIPNGTAVSKASLELLTLQKKYQVASKTYPEKAALIPNSKAYEKGKIRVKFSPEIVQILDPSLIQSDKKYVKLANENITAVNKEFGATTLKSSLYNLYQKYPSEKQFKERHQAWGLSQWYQIEIDSTQDMETILTAYAALPEVEAAEPIYKIHLIEPIDLQKQTSSNSITPSDYSWNPDDPKYSLQWGYEAIQAPQAWNYITGNPDVIVAVLDGGVQFDHPDLAANMWSGIGPDGEETVVNEHGTHVAGTVAAVSNNSTGVAGCAGGDGTADSGIKIMSLDIFNSTVSVYEAFVYAADHGAAIAQNSWAYTSPNAYNTEDLTGIDYFIQNGGGDVLDGGLAIFAAGNDGSSDHYYPAYYEDVIAVAATDEDDKVTSFSNYGDWIDIAAPGNYIYSTMDDDSYGYASGTSMACPHVSGIAALLLSAAPGQLTCTQLRDFILNNTDDITDLNPNYAGEFGSGRLNAYKALTDLVANTLSKPEAGFTLSTQNVFTGTPINFSDTSTRMPSDIQWVFEGGTPANSTSQYPEVVWFEPGDYDIKLIAGNSVGYDTLILENYIHIQDAIPASNPLQIGDSYDGVSDFPLGMQTPHNCSASIYKASEISALGDIDSLSWFTTLAQSNRPVQVYLKETSDSVFTATTWETACNEATLVYDGYLQNEDNSWTSIALNQAFSYDGTQNLMILIAIDTNLSNAGSACVYENTASNSQMNWEGSASGFSTENGTLSTQRPWIKIHFNTSLVEANFYGYQEVYIEKFEQEDNLLEWTSTDGDGDANNWIYVAKENWPLGTDENTGYMVSYSYYSGTLSPCDWLISDTIILSEETGNYLLNWNSAAYSTSYPEETYQVYVSNTTSDTTAFTQIFNETLPEDTNGWFYRSANISEFAGDTIFIAFRHHGELNDYALLLDNIKVMLKSDQNITAYEGENLLVYDASTNNPVIWQWDTPSATTESQLAKNAELSYEQSGSYAISLTTGNAYGKVFETKENFVTVKGQTPVSKFSVQGNLRSAANYGPFIPQNSTISFSNESLFSPKNYQWTFGGSETTSSTEENPSDIHFTSAGEYKVSLEASNDTGSDTASSTVTVGGPANATNFYTTDSYVMYGTATNKYITGHNVYGYTQLAEYFENDYTGTISAIDVKVYTSVGTKKYVYFYIWSEEDGLPNTKLCSKKVYLSDLNPKEENTIVLDEPVTVTGNFFVSYKISYDVNHDYSTHNFSVYQALARDEGDCTAYVNYEDSWYTMDDLFGGLITALALSPEFTYACTAPTQPDSIYGGKQVEANTTHTFYVAQDSTVIDYTWSIPDTWIGSSTSDSITVVTGNTGGTISVIANNYCGSTEVKSMLVAVDDEDIYTLQAEAGENGNISPSGKLEVLEGSEQTFYFSPDSLFYVSALIIDEDTLTYTDTSYTFNNLKADHSLKVLFSDDLTGVSNVIAQDLAIYPNPVRSVLNISGIESAELEIYNMNGQVVYKSSHTITVNNYSLDVSFLEEGIYLVKLQQEQTTSWKKMIKN